MGFRIAHHAQGGLFKSSLRTKRRAILITAKNRCRFQPGFLHSRDCCSGGPRRSRSGRRGQGSADPRQRFFTKADFDRHVEQLQKKIPSKDFTVIVTPPFVVIGDESADDGPPPLGKHRAMGRREAEKSLFQAGPAANPRYLALQGQGKLRDQLQAAFRQDARYALRLFLAARRGLGDEYLDRRGTLVHEIVHPFVAANFPNCPAWFNEGLGSLYEQSGELDGEIHGYPNWRLPRLQEAIRHGNLPSFETLCHTTDTEFYEKDRGTNYAQARYLCYYLQQKGLLTTYYRRFLASREDDPSGYKTLKAVLQRDDMDAFQKQWESYVLKLEFRRD